MKLRVATFNIHGGRPIRGRADLDAIAAVLRELDPDVVALQEVHCWPGALWNQPAALGRLLRMHVAFLPSFGVGRWGYGNALLTRELPRASLRRLPSRREPRAIIEAWLAPSGISVRIGATHLGLTPAERFPQVRAIARALAGETAPTLLLGDWNAAPDAPELGPLLDAGFLPAATSSIPTYPSNAPRLALDHLFITRDWCVKRCWAAPTSASDHLPIVADLQYAP